MNKKQFTIALSLLFMGVLPVMGMNNDKDAKKWTGVPLSEQKKWFNDLDINEIAEKDIDKGILLEQHLKDVREVESYSPLKRKGALGIILQQNFDKQQKLMGLIECASFISSSALPDLIQYGLDHNGLDHNLIPQEKLEGLDATVKSFYQIKNVYDVKPEKTLKLVKEVLPNGEKLKEYPLDQNFDAIENDIKTIKYKNDEKELHKVNDLTAHELVHSFNQQGMRQLSINTNAKKLEQRNSITKSIQDLFQKTSLPNKIALIIKLNDLNTMASKNINTIQEDTEWVNSRLRLSSGVGFSMLMGVLPYSVALAQARRTRLDILTANFGKSVANSKNFEEAYSKYTRERNLIQLSNPHREAINLMFFNKNIKLRSLSFAGAVAFASYLHFSGVASFTKAFEVSLLAFGSIGLTPLPQMYALYQYFYKQIPHDKELGEMKKEKKNIQNLIQEFKESVKKDYSF